jgi:hypothetical protein
MVSGYTADLLPQAHRLSVISSWKGSDWLKADTAVLNEFSLLLASAWDLLTCTWTEDDLLMDVLAGLESPGVSHKQKRSDHLGRASRDQRQPQIELFLLDHSAPPLSLAIRASRPLSLSSGRFMKQHAFYHNPISSSKTDRCCCRPSPSL